jgi:hypothetical protein
MHRRAIEEWQVAVRRTGGEDLDVTGARERGERTDEIVAEASGVGIAMPAVQRRVETRERAALAIAVGLEAADVRVGALDLVVAVLDESRVDVAVRKLLDERRRQSDRDLVGHRVVAQVVEEAEQRQVRPQDGLVHPLLAVRPSAGTARVRKMRVQDERESFGHRLIVCRLGTLEPTAQRHPALRA